MIEFSNREAALTIFGLIALGVILLTPKFHTSIWGLISTFLRAIIIHAFIALCTLWILISIGVLFILGIWEWQNLKVTLLWYLTFSLVTMFKSGKIIQDDDFFKESLKELITFTTLLTFIAEAYSFTFWIEMLLVPILITIGLMSEFGKGKPEVAAAQRFCSRVIVFAGFSFIGYSIYRVAGDWQAFASINTVQEFLIPAILSLTFLPCLYGFAIYEAYSNLPITKEPRRYAITKSLWEFNFNLAHIRRWIRHIRRSYVVLGPQIPSSKFEIIESIEKTKNLIYREKHPPLVALEIGWSPNIARGFLTKADIRVREYLIGVDRQTWWAASNSIQIGNGIIPHKIDYYVEGSENIATSLKITLHVNFPESPAGQYLEAEKKFCLLAHYLFETATKNKTPIGISNRIKNGNNFSHKFQQYRVSLKMDSFVNDERGYFREFSIHVESKTAIFAEHQLDPNLT